MNPWLVAILRGSLIGLTLAASSFVLWALGSKAYHPFGLEHRQNAEIGRLRAALAREEAEVRKLESDIKYLDSPDGIAYEARRKGATLPGEVLLILPASVRGMETATPESAPSPPPTWKDRLKKWLPARPRPEPASQNTVRS
ncbi:MAG: septum formation initiator family protein [Armatimonadetes bacterium]|nr:septum formation initiator family protein [Armatimonadota bacterium]